GDHRLQQDEPQDQGEEEQVVREQAVRQPAALLGGRLAGGQPLRPGNDPRHRQQGDQPEDAQRRVADPGAHQAEGQLDDDA
ncbi:hypothetical protein DF186_23155, partial [Enterococcus hirae]